MSSKKMKTTSLVLISQTLLLKMYLKKKERLQKDLVGIMFKISVYL